MTSNTREGRFTKLARRASIFEDTVVKSAVDKSRDCLVLAVTNAIAYLEKQAALQLNLKRPIDYSKLFQRPGPNQQRAQVPTPVPVAGWVQTPSVAKTNALPQLADQVATNDVFNQPKAAFLTGACEIFRAEKRADEVPGLPTLGTLGNKTPETQAIQSNISGRNKALDTAWHATRTLAPNTFRDTQYDPVLDQAHKGLQTGFKHLGSQQAGLGIGGAAGMMWDYFKNNPQHAIPLVGGLAASLYGLGSTASGEGGMMGPLLGLGGLAAAGYGLTGGNFSNMFTPSRWAGMPGHTFQSAAVPRPPDDPGMSPEGRQQAAIAHYRNQAAQLAGRHSLNSLVSPLVSGNADAGSINNLAGTLGQLNQMPDEGVQEYLAQQIGQDPSGKITLPDGTEVPKFLADRGMLGALAKDPELLVQLRQMGGRMGVDPQFFDRLNTNARSVYDEYGRAGYNPVTFAQNWTGRQGYQQPAQTQASPPSQPQDSPQPQQQPAPRQFSQQFNTPDSELRQRLYYRNIPGLDPSGYDQGAIEAQIQFQALAGGDRPHLRVFNNPQIGPQLAKRLGGNDPYQQVARGELAQRMREVVSKAPPTSPEHMNAQMVLNHLGFPATPPTVDDNNYPYMSPEDRTLLSGQLSGKDNVDDFRQAFRSRGYNQSGVPRTQDRWNDKLLDQLTDLAVSDQDDVPLTDGPRPSGGPLVGPIAGQPTSRLSAVLNDIEPAARQRLIESVRARLMNDAGGDPRLHAQIEAFLNRIKHLQ